MARERAQIDLGGPLLREREGCKLTERSLSARLCEIIERLGRVTEATMPSLTDTEWSLVCWAGWDAIHSERILSRDPRIIDAMAWQAIVAEAAERDSDMPGLAKRLHDMGAVERVAVWERVEAHGRAEAMR
jgi:hypothetical protein